MDTSRELLQRHAASLEQTIRAAFPDSPFAVHTPIGCGYWTSNEHAEPAYRFGGLPDSLEVEAFFRAMNRCDLIRDTPQQTYDTWDRFFTAPPPAKRWLAVVGDPLLCWGEVTSSWMFMSVPARVYYLPAYVLTALPLLVAMRFEDLPYVSGRAAPVEFVVHTVEALIPPLDLKVWEALRHRPPERRDPYAMDFSHRSTEEEFLRLVGLLTRPQRQVIGQFVALTLVTHPFYVVEPSCSDQADMDALRQCWIPPGGI